MVRAHPTPTDVSVLEPCTRPGASEDERTIARAAGEATASEIFELVYRQMRKLAPRRDFEELVQIAAEQAIRGLPTFQRRSRLSTWTFRICYLTVKKHDRWYRRWLRRFTLTTDGDVPERATEADADARVAASERSTRLRAALDRLTEKQRTVIVLHDLEALSIDDVAEIVRAAPAAVRSRLRDARRALGAILGGDPYFGDEACRKKEEP